MTRFHLALRYEVVEGRVDEFEGSRYTPLPRHDPVEDRDLPVGEDGHTTVLCLL
jgi:hypothetical protein